MPLKTFLAALILAAVAPASASADSISCRVGYYAPGADTASPTVTNLRAHNLPRKTDGYAPRCLVAESIVAEIQRTYGDRGDLPARVRVYGARWSGGRWRCSYPVERAVCRKIGKPRRRVTMDLATPG